MERIAGILDLPFDDGDGVMAIMIRCHQKMELKLKIASLRIHVEQAINRIKLKFPYLAPSKTPFPVSYIKPSVNSFWVNFLCNVQDPILS